VLLHEPGQVEAARALATRMQRDGGDTIEQRIGYAFALALGRPPESGEITVLQDLLVAEMIRFQDNPATAEAWINFGESAPDSDLDIIELAAHTTLARLILNLDETITQP